MLHHKLLPDDGILIVTPRGPLSSDDFGKLASEVDPHIDKKGSLDGLMIYTESFPGWDDFAALISHFKFIRDHHQKITKIAAVTESGILTILPHLAGHFVRADIRHFNYDQKAAALTWLKTRPD